MTCIVEMAVFWYFTKSKSIDEIQLKYTHAGNQMIYHRLLIGSSSCRIACTRERVWAYYPTEKKATLLMASEDAKDIDVVISNNEITCPQCKQLAIEYNEKKANPDGSIQNEQAPVQQYKN